MTYRVVHRPDQLLQVNNARERDPEIENTFIGMYTIPAHQALERFIDERLIGREFETLEELGLALEEWQSFYYQMHQRAPYRDWSELYIGRGEYIAAATSGMGGDFCCAMIEQIEAETPTTSESETETKVEVNA